MTITITKFPSNDYNETITISNYNDYNKQKWQFLIASFANSKIVN